MYFFEDILMSYLTGQPPQEGCNRPAADMEGNGEFDFWGIFEDFLRNLEDFLRN